MKISRDSGWDNIFEAVLLSTCNVLTFLHLISHKDPLLPPILNCYLGAEDRLSITSQ